MQTKQAQNEMINFNFISAENPNNKIFINHKIYSISKTPTKLRYYQELHPYEQCAHEKTLSIRPLVSGSAGMEWVTICSI